MGVGRFSSGPIPCASLALRSVGGFPPLVLCLHCTGIDCALNSYLKIFVPHSFSSVSLWKAQSAMFACVFDLCYTRTPHNNI
jgi:hypothetical protein